MTPLAQQITKQTILPLKRRHFADRGGLLARMDDIHCFECSDVLGAAKELSLDMYHRPKQIGQLAFLPAPKTWIEWEEAGGGRVAILLTEIRGADGRSVAATLDLVTAKAGFKAGLLELTGSIAERAPAVMSFGDMPESKPYEEAAITFLLYAFLAMINTPKIINRRQHMPHRGFERDLVRAMKPTGRFPLHAWTEIKLDISPPKDLGCDPPIEAHLTGQRALHFCRAHLRIRLGRLEIVRSHWRGDASLGIKQSRYRMVA